MIFEVLLIFPLYAIIFGIFFRFRRLIKVMTEIDEIFSTLSSEDDEVSKRDFLVEKIKNGETISNSKTPWTCLLYTSPSPRDATLSRMQSSA